VIWSEEGVRGATRFLQRVWRIVNVALPHLPPSGTTIPKDNAEATELRAITHRTINDVATGIERLRFNTAIAKLYTFVGTLQELVDDPGAMADVRGDPGYAAALREAFDVLAKLISPMMPHLAEECWRALGHDGFVATAEWPQIERDLLVEDTMTLPVQVNGRKRADLTIGRAASNTEIEAAVLSLDAVKKALEGKAPKKVIVVPQRIVNVVG
jgi:leucyl-tRNA synthetase